MRGITLTKTEDGKAIFLGKGVFNDTTVMEDYSEGTYIRTMMTVECEVYSVVENIDTIREKIAKEESEYLLKNNNSKPETKERVYVGSNNYGN